MEWCDACDWNVDPGAPDPEPGRIAAVRRRLVHRHGEKLAADLERGAGIGTPPGREAVSVSAFGLSLLVHGFTALLVVAGVLLVAAGWDAGPQPVIGVVLLGLAAVLRPRPRRLPKDGPVLHRQDAPHLFGLIDEVAAAVGTVGPHPAVVACDGTREAAVAAELGPAAVTLARRVIRDFAG
ncbi:hypothetical protein [Streptomyces sp. NPDC057939]|uniref:hypothetical protein n=1 Tax=Streptomyces sp. NPDC057939 TaxID=3346284 RepID=UPI0036E0227D